MYNKHYALYEIMVGKRLVLESASIRHLDGRAHLECIESPLALLLLEVLSGRAHLYKGLKK